MKSKRIVSLALLLAIMLTAAVSCTDIPPADGKTDGTGNSVSTAEDLYPDDLPDTLRFDGTTLRLLTNDEETFLISDDEENIVNYALYTRMEQIENRFGVEVEPIIDTAWKGVANKLQQAVTTDDPIYDIYAGYGYTSTPLGTAGYMMNLSDMEYLDLDQPWWGEKFINAMAYKDYIYWLTGDIVLYYTSGIYCTYVNQTEWSNRFHDTSIFDVVRDGQWTLDKLREYAEVSYQDLNNDNTVDKEDFIGYVYSTEDAIDGMSIAAGVHYTEFDADGVPQLVFGNDDTALRFNEKLQALCMSSGTLLVESDFAKVPPTQFAQGNVMFIVGNVFQAERYLREMEDDYAIIPAPKMDENQTDYITTIHDGITIIGLPKTNTSEINKAACAVLEALAAYSYEEVTPLYLDSVLKGKYSRDPESAEMIDLIRKNIIADFGFQNSETGFCNFFRSRATSAGTLTSTIQANKSQWTIKLQTILDHLEENAE